MDGSVAPPFDPQARDRVEVVAHALMQLCGRLEARIAALEQQQAEMEDALTSLGMVQVPRG